METLHALAVKPVGHDCLDSIENEKMEEYLAKKRLSRISMDAGLRKRK
jgi:hypothetical protein